MTRQVALSERAYAELRRLKAGNDSFSDVVLRVISQAQHATKDPMRFAKFPHKFLLSMEEHLRQVEEGRDNDRADAWDEGSPKRTRKRGA